MTDALYVALHVMLSDRCAGVVTRPQNFMEYAGFSVKEHVAQNASKTKTCARLVVISSVFVAMRSSRDL